MTHIDDLLSLILTYTYDDQDEILVLSFMKCINSRNIISVLGSPEVKLVVLPNNSHTKTEIISKIPVLRDMGFNNAGNVYRRNGTEFYIPIA